nr:hypothetical protein [Tanacetum cinerariifolium]
MSSPPDFQTNNNTSIVSDGYDTQLAPPPEFEGRENTSELGSADNQSLVKAAPDEESANTASDKLAPGYTYMVPKNPSDINENGVGRRIKRVNLTEYYVKKKMDGPTYQNIIDAEIMVNEFVSNAHQPKFKNCQDLIDKVVDIKLVFNEIHELPLGTHGQEPLNQEFKPRKLKGRNQILFILIKMSSPPDFQTNNNTSIVSGEYDAELAPPPEFEGRNNTSELGIADNQSVVKAAPGLEGVVHDNPSGANLSSQTTSYKSAPGYTYIVPKNPSGINEDGVGRRIKRVNLTEYYVKKN